LVRSVKGLRGVVLVCDYNLVSYSAFRLQYKRT